MSAFHWLALGAGMAMFCVCTGFLTVFMLKRAIDAGVWMPVWVKGIGYFWLAVGVPADAAYNLVIGTLEFREWPRELMFSSRVQRLVDEGEGWRRERAIKWARFLNVVDPKPHIKRVPD